MKKTKKVLQKTKVPKRSEIYRTASKANITIGFLVVIFGLLGYLFLLTKQMNDLRDNPVALGVIMSEAAEGLNKPLAVHAETGNLFLPEARLVLAPAPAEQGSFVYHYVAKDETSPAEVTIASRALINKAKVIVIGADSTKGVLNAIPKLQSCARGFKLYFEEKSDFSGTKVFEKTLNDGRKIFAYQEDGCTEQRDDIVVYLKQIQSY